MRYSWKGYWGTIAAAAGIELLGILVLVTIPGIAWPKAGAVSAVLLAAFAMALAAYRYADEIILQTHKAAWFWGGMVGCGAMLPMMICLRLHVLTLPSLLLDFSADPQVFFVEGMLFMLFIQAIGFYAVLAYQRMPKPRG